MIASEEDLEGGITQVISALQSQVEGLRARREARAAHDAENPLPEAELEGLIASSAAALIEAEAAAPAPAEVAEAEAAAPEGEVAPAFEAAWTPEGTSETEGAAQAESVPDGGSPEPNEILET
jgi:hypothetical protein